jgi:hypothetical protein
MRYSHDTDRHWRNSEQIAPNDPGTTTRGNGANATHTQGCTCTDRLEHAKTPKHGAGKIIYRAQGVNLQDIVVQESMGTIVDRTKENLGLADLAIVHFRSLLLETADGKAAAQPDFAPNLSYQGLKARDGLLPITQDWTTLYPADSVQWQATP